MKKTKQERTDVVLGGNNLPVLIHYPTDDEVCRDNGGLVWYTDLVTGFIRRGP